MAEHGIRGDGDPDPGGLEWLSLDDGETILWAGGPDRRTLIPAFVVGIPLAIVLVGIVIIVTEYLRVANTDYVVTDRALYRKTGILSRDVKRVDFDKVQNISYAQSALGTRLGYGTIEISTAGGAGVELEFASIPDPQRIQALIGEQIERGRGHARGSEERSDERTKDDVLEEIRLELRTIRHLLEEDAVEGTRSRTDDPDRDRDRDSTRNPTQPDQAASTTDGETRSGRSESRSGGDE